MNAEMTILDLQTLIEARDFVSLREQIRNWPAGDLAELMEPLSAENEAVVFRLLPRDEAANVFSYLPIERQQELLKAMAHEEVVSILNDMSDDDRTELLEELPDLDVIIAPVGGGGLLSGTSIAATLPARGC